MGERLAAVDAGTLFAHLRRSVLAWMDEDRVLPADGSSLLSMLDRGLDGLIAADAAAAQAAIEAFSIQARALIEAGVLEATDGYPRLEMAAELAALLPLD